MRYVSFRFEDFRGIRDATLELQKRSSDARIFALVGLNESGKTTILEAIDQFLPATEEPDEVSPKELAGWIAPEPDDLIPISKRTNFNGSIRISARVELDESDISFVKTRVRRRIGFRIQSLNSTIDITVVYKFENSRFAGKKTTWTANLGNGYKPTGKLLREITSKSEPTAWIAVVNAIRQKLPQIWYFPNFLFEFPRRIVLTESDEESPANQFYRKLFQDILDALDKDLEVQDHVISRAQSSEAADQRNLKQLLLELSRDVTTSVVDAWNKLFNQPNELASARVAISLAEPDSPGEVAVEFTLEGSDGIFGIHERSLGFRWFFVYLLLTHYRGQRKMGAGELLFLFDEPASNLHPTAQAALLESLGKLSEHSVVIYTTHSHHLVNPAWLSSTFVVVNEGVDPRRMTALATARNSDIRIERLHHFAAQNPNRSHYFQPVLDVLDYTPSQLELIPGAVMLEGKSDYFLMRYFCEIYDPTNTIDPFGFLPGTGSGSLLTLIQLYSAWSRPFVVLLDSDRAGSSARKKYEAQLGPLMSGRILDLQDATGEPEVTAIESLLGSADMIKFQRLVDPASEIGNKKIFAQGLQEAFAAKIKVKLSESTEARLSKIMTRIRIALNERAAESQIL